MRNIQQHFSIRKLTVGAASVLIGISFLATANTNEIHADTLNDSTQTVQTETKQSAASENTKTVQESSAQNVKTDNTESVAQSADAQTAKPADASNENANKSVDDPTALTQKSDANTKDAVSVSNTETENANNQSSGKQDDSLAQSELNLDKTTSSATQSKDTEQKKDLVETTVLKVLNIKPGTEKGVQNLAESKVEESDPANNLSASLSDGTTISINRDEVGAVDDTSNLIIHVAYHNAKQGDKYVITIPRGAAYQLLNLDGQRLQTYGKTTFSNTDKADVVTNEFEKSDSTGLISQTFRLGVKNNYNGQDVNMAEIGDVLKTITIDKTDAEGHKDSTSVSFTQIINPEMHPNFQRIVPDKNTSNVYANTDYTYELDLNETSGINKGNTFPSGQANNAVNWGTTITIPVPPDFVLNKERTTIVNNFNRAGDTTMIEQIGGKGGNIIITVPKGSGRQNWEGAPGYRLVGHYETDKEGTTTANSKITIHQLVTRADGSTYYIDKKIDTLWTEHLTKMNADQISPIQVGISGYAPSGEITTDIDPTRPINEFTFKNENPYNIENPNITLDFDDKMEINRITTPKSLETLPGTTTYQYKAVLTNGQTVTGVLNAGEDLTTNGNDFIKSVVLTPNMLAAGADATYGPNHIKAYGKLSDKAKNGDNLITKIGANYATNIDGKTVFSTITPDPTCTQVVKEKSAAFGTYGYQTKNSAGSTDSGYISIYRSYGSIDATAHEVEDPIFYYVLPRWTTYNEQIGLTGKNSGAKIDPKITTFWVGDREVVKIDYSGTGDKISTMDNANTQIHLDISPLADPGAYRYTIYVESQKTALNHDLASTTSDFNPAFTENKTDRVYKIDSGQWNIGNATETGIMNGAIGNKDQIAVSHGISDNKKAPDMAFDFRVVNHNQQLNNATAVIDLSDTDTNSFNFQLTGPVTVDQQSENDHTQILYSVDVFNNSATTVGAQPDLSAFKTADQMTDNDWANVKAIAFKFGNLGDNTGSSVFRINGKDAHLARDAGKSYSYSTYLFGEGVIPSYTPNRENPSITISGKSTIKYQVHYTDENGQDRTIALNDLNQTYNDGQDKMPSKDDVKTAFDNYVASQAPNTVIPGHYKLSDITIVNGDKTWQTKETDDPNDTINWGDTIQYFADGDIVQFNLVPEARGSVKVVYHDDTTDSDINGYGYNSGQLFDGAHVDYNNSDIEDAKTTLTNQGYVYVSTDGIVPDKITANENTTVTVHMRHDVVEITSKTPTDQVPVNTVEAAHPDKLTKEVTLTVNYFNNDGTPFTGTVPANAHQTITFNGTAYVDAVTGQIVNAKQENGQLVIDEDNTKTPAVIWTSDKTSFDKVISPAENGYHVISVSDHKDVNDVGVIDGINFDSANIEVTVTYAPDPKSEPEPQPEPQPEPDSKPDDNTPTPTPDNTPDNTIVPKGETDNGENKPNEVKRADKKTHKSVEKGNGAVVKGADKPTKSNAKRPGTKQGHIDDNSTSKVTKSPRKATQAKTESKSTNRKAALPQTGEKTTSLVWLGLGLASLATIIDLAGDRKRR
ncbi:mucin-binding protein [uncultured Lactobacillus sp.]|uniref:mucin-binding protein n=1 Tax=uncultured Lactobacillus sp. TaxID=153152 RepID=UPI0025892C0D|nr:YSIRK-type signal peptide-containing protein [uncultured Lactobacillus sp.]